MENPEINRKGNKFWRNEKGEFHREDGPAIERANGDKFWFLNNELHREDGPAIEYADGDKRYYKDGVLHREDGPAIERANGVKEYWINGKRLSEEDFKYAIKKQNQNPVIDGAGNKLWRNEKGQIHRIEYVNGNLLWYQNNNNLHPTNVVRVDKCADGSKSWLINGKHLSEEEFNKGVGKSYIEIDACGNKFCYNEGLLHCENGPAVEYVDGTKEYWVNGKLHREDGPAIKSANGDKYWYLNDNQLSEEEFNKIVNNSSVNVSKLSRSEKIELVKILLDDLFGKE